MTLVSLYTDTPELAGEICDEIRLFLPVKRIEYVEEKTEEGIFIRHEFDEEAFSHRCSLYENGILKANSFASEHKPDEQDILLYKKMKKRGAKRAAFECLKSVYPQKSLPWGNLTGIRPTKLYRDLRQAEGDNADDYMRREFEISEEKLSLLKEINSIQQPYIDSVRDDVIDVYIGIPFCTTKCAYCSFVSGLTSKDGSKERGYVDALLKEMDMLKGVLERYKVRSVYIGGGTPT